MGLRGWVKRKAKKAKKDLKKTGKTIEKTAKATGKIFEQAGGQVKNTAEDLAKETEEFFTKEAKSVVQKIFNDAKRDIERFAESAVKDTKDAFVKELPALAEKAFDETKEAFEKELPSLLEKALGELQKAITKEGLTLIRNGVRTADRELEALAKRKPDLAAALDRPGFKMKLGPLTLAYSGFFTRSAKLADSLDSYVNSPPVFRRRPLIQLVEALGPDTVDLGVDISVALLVVQSDTLSLGFALDEIPMEVFSEISDSVLKALGVPE